MSYHIKQLNDLITALQRCSVRGRGDTRWWISSFEAPFFSHAPVAFTQMKPQSLYGKQEGLETGTKTESGFLRDSIVVDCYCTYSIYVQLGGHWIYWKILLVYRLFYEGRKFIWSQVLSLSTSLKHSVCTLFPYQTNLCFYCSATCQLVLFSFKKVWYQEFSTQKSGLI